MAWRLTSRESATHDGDLVRSPVLIVWSGHDYLCPVTIRVDDLVLRQVVHDEGGGAEAERRVFEAVQASLIGRLRDMLASGLPPVEEPTTVHQVIEADGDIGDELVRILRFKRCSYQETVRNEMYCGAASNDTARIGTVDLRSYAPTSETLCRMCELPDSRLLCSHLTHADVQSLDWNQARELNGASCHRGEPGVYEDPTACRPGGHDCWELSIDRDRTHLEGPVDPLALPESLDHLDVVWRLTFPEAGRLLNKGTVKDLVSIGLDCDSRAEFEERVVDLADLLTRLNVASDLVPVEARSAGPLLKLRAALEAKDDGTMPGIEESIGFLRAIVDIRNGVGHSGASIRLHANFQILGLSYPPAEWSAAWDGLRLVALASVRRLRDAVAAIQAQSEPD